ncbi:MAG TPA: efflux RND transporter periplasmic adaptor subunit [Azospirillaceae bacterium]|nr:efflux RND transporter periplasmic adaptor subunit [Azospirillaceae bacterium]
MNRLVTALAVMLAAESAAAQQTKTELSARAVIAPRVETTLSAQISGRLLRVTAERGGRVAKGDVLAEFDCSLEQARAKAAQADLDGAQARLTNLQRLDRMGSVGKVDVRVAAAEVDKAAALLDERRGVLRYCVISAPFDGVATDVQARAFASIEAGKPLISLIDDRTLRIEALTPSHWAAWLRPGLPLRFTVDETGETFSAVVTGVDGRIDPGSQTVAVFAEPRRDAKSAPFMAGMTGSAVFDAAAANPTAPTQ